MTPRVARVGGALRAVTDRASGKAVPVLLVCVAISAVAFTWALWPRAGLAPQDREAVAQMRALARQVAADPAAVERLPAGVVPRYEPLGQGGDVLTGKLLHPLTGGRCAVVDVALGRAWFTTGERSAVQVTGPSVLPTCPTS